MGGGEGRERWLGGMARWIERSLCRPIPRARHPPALDRPAAGTWVAWKQPGDKAAAGGDLFVSGSFYNLLCPQRPTTV